MVEADKSMDVDSPETLDMKNEPRDSDAVMQSPDDTTMEDIAPQCCPDFNSLPVEMLAQLLANLRKKSPELDSKVAEALGGPSASPILATDTSDTQNVNKSAEELEKEAAAQQYQELKTAGPASPNSLSALSRDPENIDHIQTHSESNISFTDKAKFVPIRLSYNERPYLRLLEAATACSSYTDKVDSILAENNPRLHNKRITLQCKLMCALFTGLLTANDYEAGKRVMIEKDFSKHEGFFKAVFEIGRRYKILNPERLREAYGKMIYVLQDSHSEEIRDLLGFSCVEAVRSVFAILGEHESGRALLQDQILHVATMEIFSNDRPRREIDRELRAKEDAKKTLRRKYATQHRHVPYRGNYNLFRFDVQGDDQTTIGYRPNTQTLDEDTLEQCIASLGDHNTYLRFNRDSSDQLIKYLKTLFSPTNVDSEFPLAITEGKDGARLSHSHERQYHFVLQSLLLWREVLAHMFQLWHYAEQDLLDPASEYTLTQTGQGLQRVQPCKRVHAAMIKIVERVQKQCGVWIGSAQIHCGDKNVPNALIFIDKYTQVPRICAPIVLCLDSIPELYRKSPLARKFIDDGYGGAERLQKRILSDFFRHAFDGSGGDNFFDAGSCVDGRLTSAWNWCSRVESKEYFPIFLLSGFTGFDGKEGWE